MSKPIDITSNDGLEKPSRSSSPSVGSTERKELACSCSAFLSTKNAGQLVPRILARVCGGLDLDVQTTSIVESLCWVFACWYLTRASTQPSNKPFAQMCSSLRGTTIRVKALRDEDCRDQTYVKYWLDVLINRVAKDSVLPECPSYGQEPLFQGYCARVISRRIVKKDYSFVYSLAKGCKQMWPALSAKREREALMKHMKILSRDNATVPDDLQLMIDWVAVSVFSLNTHKRIPSKFLPTGSACLQVPRSSGGVLGLVTPFDITRLEEIGSPDKSGVTRKIGKLHTLHNSLTQWRKVEYLSFLHKGRKKLYTPGLGGTSEASRVKIMTVKEPAKFRVLGIMDGHVQAMLQPLQGMLLDAWKSCRYSTMLHDDLTERVTAIFLATSTSNFSFFSVDYSSATDLQNRATTRRFIEALPSDCPLKADALASLSQVYLATYPGLKEGGRIPEAYLNEGQLMGHALSFPVLCAVNLAVYWTALGRWAQDPLLSEEERQRRRPVMSLVWHWVIVNGDDMLFRMEESFLPIFRETAAQAGFLISQGKNYVSRTFCMINSQIFGTHGKSIKRYGYLNLRLVKGINVKTKGGTSEATPAGVARDISKMALLCPLSAPAVPAAMKRVCEKFFPTPQKRDQRICSRLVPNWYLPSHLGGLGLSLLLAPDNLRITRDQRLFAAHCAADERIALLRATYDSLDLLSGDIPTRLPKGFEGSLINPVLCHDGVVPDGAKDVDNKDLRGWIERLMYATRASDAGKEPKARLYRRGHWTRQYRLKPMSDEGLMKWWNPRIVAFPAPPCPPACSLQSVITFHDQQISEGLAVGSPYVSV